MPEIEYKLHSQHLISGFTFVSVSDEEVGTVALVLPLDSGLLCFCIEVVLRSWCGETDNKTSPFIISDQFTYLTSATKIKPRPVKIMCQTFKVTQRQASSYQPEEAGFC